MHRDKYVNLNELMISKCDFKVIIFSIYICIQAVEQKVVEIKKVDHRVFQEKPTYGTVGSVLFAKGEQGLLGDDVVLSTSALIAEKKPEREWEAHLQYGKPKNKTKPKKEEQE